MGTDADVVHVCARAIHSAIALGQGPGKGDKAPGTKLARMFSPLVRICEG